MRYLLLSFSPKYRYIGTTAIITKSQLNGLLFKKSERKIWPEIFSRSLNKLFVRDVGCHLQC